MKRRVFVAAVIGLCGVAAPAFAQGAKLISDVRREGEHLAESCGSFNGKAIAGCAYALITSSPFHISVGSLAPGNGMAFGVAVSERHTPNEAWRITWSGDAVRSFQGSYRFGGYAKFIHTPADVGVVVRRPGDPPVRPRRVKLDTWVIDVVAMTTFLETIDYYGLGADSLEGNRTTFGERQSLIGGSVILPMSGASWFGALHPALIGGITSRLVDIRPGVEKDVPSIETLFSGYTPGLDFNRRDGFVEFRGGIRFRPALPNGRLKFNYLASAQRFRTSADSRGSFSRWTLDLQHEVPLYQGSSSPGPPADFNGPNECSSKVDSLDCPPITRSRDRSGSVGLRMLLIGSGTKAGNDVPFFFQPTLGGSDINGERLVASFDDYRFRGRNVLLFQESLEHSLWGPIGVIAAAEQGTVARRAGDLGSSTFARSFGAGLTVRAGGLPAMTLMLAWGREGHHIVATVNTALLGGSARPSLY